MTLGESVYKHRTQKGWSQADLAESLDVSRQSVSKWENSSAVPDLDNLIKMSKLFDISLDELVFGEQAEEPPQIQESIAQSVVTSSTWPSTKMVIGFALLMFGMIFFLLSVFWGDSLRFGEEFGETASLLIILISVAILATSNFKILSVCMVIYVTYSIICFGIFSVANFASYMFTFIASYILLVWFIIWGLKTSKKK